jgi:hypothetical protein
MCTVGESSYIPNPGTGTLVRTGDFAGGGITGASLAALLTPTLPFTYVIGYKKSYSQAALETLLGIGAGAAAGTTNQLQLVTSGTQAQLVHSGGSGTLTGTLVHDGTTVNKIAVSVDPINAKMSISANGGTAVETTGIAYTGAGVTSLIPGAETSGGLDPLISGIIDPLRVIPGRYLTGTNLSDLST